MGKKDIEGCTQGKNINGPQTLKFIQLLIITYVERNAIF